MKDITFKTDLANALQRTAEIEQKSKAQSDSSLSALGYSQTQIENLHR